MLDEATRRRPESGRLRQIGREWRPSAVTLGAPIFPLAVLFGLNAVDELDRTAFAVLLPDIRDHFGLSNASALGLVAVTTIAIVVIEVPLAFYADRGNRVRIAAAGAAVWALFSAGPGSPCRWGCWPSHESAPRSAKRWSHPRTPRCSPTTTRPRRG